LNHKIELVAYDHIETLNFQEKNIKLNKRLVSSDLSSF